MIWLLLIALAHPPCYGDGHNGHRNRAALREFRHAHPCPGGPDAGSKQRCRGYVIDHVVPLACCGIDAPQNMAWQTVKDAKAKDRWELNCNLPKRRH